MRTMCFERVGDVMILVHGAEQPSANEWNKYAEAVRQAIQAQQAVGQLLVITEGGGPNAAQRKQIVEAYAPSPTPVAICSDATMVRAMVTAVSWFHRNPMRSFKIDELEEALRFLQIEPQHWVSMKQVSDQLRTNLKRAV